ncbi:MAG: YraN family protein [Lachnospiraceae bacterium]|nr:YraN family protein [Lachnospiraceae bacterium]
MDKEEKGIKNKRELGTKYEKTAMEYLQTKGVHILQSNYRNRYGEIDIIALDGDTLCFVEVKYRKTGKAGTSEESVGYAKQKQICKISDFYRMQNQIPFHTPIRFDVIAVNDDRIRWMKNAFDYCGNSYF